jgi:hypothetical protein
MKPNIHHTLLIYFLLISNFGFSQDKKDTLNLKSSLLFPQFTEGTVIFKDGSSNRAMLNYDTSLDEMQFIGPKNENLAFAEPEKISMVIISNRQFINYNNHFVEILVDGNVTLCLKVCQKRFAEKVGAYGGTSPSSSLTTYSSIRLSDGFNTKLSTNEVIKIKTEFLFYLLQDDRMKQIFNLIKSC